MNERDERALAFLGLHLLYFPALVALLHGWSRGYNALELQWPPVISETLPLLLAAGLYVGLGYAVAGMMRRRHPFSRPGTVPDPTQSGR